MDNNENRYFTEITENEKRIINLVRSYVVPFSDVNNYVDFLVDDLMHKLLTKTLRLQAFTEVMQDERDNKELSNVQLLARVNMYEKFLESNENVMAKHSHSLLSDIVNNLEGDIKPIEIYSKMDQLEEEEKSLDKTE